MHLAPGTIVAERYRLDRLLGQGGMGSVWAATHVVTRKQVAAKFLRTQMATQDMIRRFFREARAASAVRHANVVQVHDMFSTADGDPVMVMDLLQGEPLSARLAREHKLPLQQTAGLLLPVASAIGTAHTAGVVHRDLKPDNIFLEQVGDGPVTPKVLDFGIAKLRPVDGGDLTGALTETGALLGTPHYMAPEQAFGEKDVDHRADVWAFGVILYECLSGRRPVDGDNLGQLFRLLMTGNIPRLQTVAPDVPEDIASLIDRMLSVDREARPSDMREPFELLRKYSDVTAVSFSGARQSVHTDSFGGGPQEIATEPTLNASSTTPAPSAPGSRRMAVWLTACAAIVIAAGALYGARRAMRSGGDASDLTPSQEALSAAVPSAILPEPAASMVGSSSLAASALAPAQPAAKASASKVAPAHSPAAPATSATPAASAAPTTSAKSRLPGGVVGAAPF